MPADPLQSVLLRLGRRVAPWPPMLRDPLAVTLALWSLCLGVLLAMLVPLPNEVLLALPGVLLAWWLLGWSSALFGLLVTALVVGLVGERQSSGRFAIGSEEALTLFTLAGLMLTGCLGAWLWIRQRERRASLLMDACAEDAISRISAAEARLAEAEAEAQASRGRLAGAEAELARALRSAALAARRDAALDGGLEEARRREGGV
jgi:hypothetical protein